MCLSDLVAWEESNSLPAQVLARTRLHHGHEPRFRDRLPLICGLVRFECGPVAVCFLAETAVAGDRILVRMGTDGLLAGE